MTELTFISRKDKEYTVLSTKGTNIDILVNSKVNSVLPQLEGCEFSLYKTKGYGEQEQILEALYGKIANGQLIFN